MRHIAVPPFKEAGTIEFGGKVTSMFNLMKTDTRALIVVLPEAEVEYEKKLEERIEIPWPVGWDQLLKVNLHTDTQMRDVLGHCRK